MNAKDLLGASSTGRICHSETSRGRSRIPESMLLDELFTELRRDRRHIAVLLGRLPETGEIISLDGFEAEVTAVGEARIGEVRFRLGREDRDS